MQIKVYRTSDLSFASTLHSLDRKLINIEKDEGKSTFVFDDPGDTHELLIKYLNNELQVIALKWVKSRDTLKSLVHGSY